MRPVAAGESFWPGEFRGLRPADGCSGAPGGKVIAANMWGKVKTVLQMLTILFYYFAAAFSSGGDIMAVGLISMALCWLVALVTLLSGGIYLWQNRECFMNAK